MAGERRNWTRDELIVAFNLYCRIPFGQVHKGNPDIVQVAELIERTPSALSMKMVNFARLDPAHQSRNVGGLSHGSKQDEKVWREFHANWEQLAWQSQIALERLTRATGADDLAARAADSAGDVTTAMPHGPTETTRPARIRLVQQFFRQSVLSSYDHACAICHLALPNMLNASHIIPWSVSVEQRADPCNGLSLCALHDRAFDRGLFTIDEHLRARVSGDAWTDEPPELHRIGLLEIEGQPIRLPERFRPDPEALAYHRENVFLGTG